MFESPTRFRWAIAGLVVFKLVINTVARAVYPFLPAIARGLGISLSAAGALVSIRWGASMGTPFLIAWLGKRRTATTLMTAGGLAFALGAFVTAASGVFVGAVVGFLLLGISKPVFDIATNTWISDLVPFNRRGRVIGVLEMSWAGGLLIGAPLFGWLIDANGWTAPFWVVGGLSLVGSVVVGVIARRSGEAPAVTADVGKTRLTKGLVGFLAGASLMSAAIELVLVIMGEWLEVGFGLTLLALGGIGTILGIAELVAEGGVLGFTDRVGSRRAMQVGTIGMVVGFLAMTGLSGTLVGGVGAVTFTLLLFEFGIVSAIPLATELMPDNRPRFLAMYLVVSAGGRVVADWTGPWLFAQGGITSIGLAGAGVSAVALGIITRWVRQPA